MERQDIVKIAQNFGLVLEPAAGLAGDEGSFRVYKGANQIFTGSEEAIRGFFVRYERNRPGPFVEGMYGYQE